MGLFGRIIKGGYEFNKLAKVIGRVIDLLDAYEIDHDFSMLCEAAWLCRLGIIDKMEKYHFGMNATIYVPIQGSLHKMILNEAFMCSIGKLSAKSNKLLEGQKETIEDIMEKGQSFYALDKQIPYEEKKKYI